jgi:hypothetical protein
VGQALHHLPGKDGTGAVVSPHGIREHSGQPEKAGPAHLRLCFD